MQKRPEDILIIKTGYSEFLEDVKDRTDVSLGDIFRITPLLELYGKRGDNISWLTDETAIDLLVGNLYLKEVIPFKLREVMDLLDRKFDKVINLEKNRELCKLACKIDAWCKYGFRIDYMDGSLNPYDRAGEAFMVGSNPILKKVNKRFAQDLLFELVGERWNGEEYSLGYIPKSPLEYDFALNVKVGKKWPNKAWAPENWDSLESKLSADGFRVTRQDRLGEEIFRDLKKYIDWINSAKIIITSDSFGMHVALALKKKVIGLFGPTPSSEIYFYGRGESILPETLPECLPCFKNACEHEPEKNIGGCMNTIVVDRVYDKAIAYASK
jgi:heptosyltransferase-2